MKETENKIKLETLSVWLLSYPLFGQELMRKLTLPGNLLCYLKYGSIIIAITLVVNLCYGESLILSLLTVRGESMYLRGDSQLHLPQYIWQVFTGSI